MPRKKYGGRNFTVGNKFGKGRPSLPPDIKEARKFNQNEFTRIINSYLYRTKDELKELQKDIDLTIIEQTIIKFLLETEKQADTRRLELLLNRTIGRAPDRVDVKTNNNFNLALVDILEESG